MFLSRVPKGAGAANAAKRCGSGENFKKKCITALLTVQVPGIEPVSAKSYPSALAARVLPLGRARTHRQPRPQFGYITALLYPLSATEKNPKKGTLLDFWQGTLIDILLYLKRGFEVLALGEMCFEGMGAVEKGA